MKTLLLILVAAPTLIVGPSVNDANATAWILNEAEEVLDVPVPLNLPSAMNFLGQALLSKVNPGSLPKMEAYLGSSVNVAPKSEEKEVSSSVNAVTKSEAKVVSSSGDSGEFHGQGLLPPPYLVAAGYSPHMGAYLGRSANAVRKSGGSEVSSSGDSQKKISSTNHRVILSILALLLIAAFL
ncbi:unnamed protein product [Orchesella dallaii]|uniref:Uncharacterized protein n=1 Tax=Orchesella dallaii TaxID=48710 RepID=A0ABP1QMX2_9HEXA